MGVDRIVPLAVLAPFELVGRGNLVPGRELALLLLEEQVEDLLHLGDVEVVADHCLGAFDLGARQRLRRLGPLDDRHLGLIGRFLLGSLEVGDQLPRLLCIQIRM